jgi:hypothetical protein
MCVMSMVHDHFNPLFPNITPVYPVTYPVGPAGIGTPDPTPPNPLAAQPTPNVPWFPVLPIDELKSLILQFREAVEAARKVDILTKQPDCVDPEKQKLELRVAALEARVLELESPTPKRRRTRKKLTT